MENRKCIHCEFVGDDTRFSIKTRRKNDVKVREVQNICKDCSSQKRNKYQRDRIYSKYVAVECGQCGYARHVNKHHFRYWMDSKADALCHRCSQSEQPRGAGHPNWTGTANVPSRFFCTWRMNAKKRGKEFAVNIFDIQRLWEKQKGICALTGRTMTTKQCDVNRMSLDRIDSSRGYVAGNIQLTCFFANVGKQSFSTAEYVSLAIDVVKYNSVSLGDYVAAVVS